MADPIPGDDAGAELVVARPRLPGHDLEELLNAVEVPLAAARGLDDQRLRAFTIEVARLGRITEAGRLAIGAALHQRRALAKRGEWTPLVAGLAEAAGVTTDTLGRWVLAAERHYGLELAKGANPTRRGPLPSRRPAGLLASGASKNAAGGATKPPAGRGATTAPSKGPGPVPPPAAAPGGDDSPGAGARTKGTKVRTDPVPPPEGREEVCPRCHGTGTVPVAGRGNAARVDAAAAARRSCAHRTKRVLGYLTLCADCGENLSGR